MSKKRGIHSDLKERIKELHCLYGLSSLADKHEISEEEFLQSAVELIPPSWQYPDITCARITVNEIEYTTKGFKETQWIQTAPVRVNQKKAGLIEVYYLEEKPQIDEGPFLKEERNLLDTFAKNLGNNLERIQKEQELKESRDLLTRTQQLAHIGHWEFDLVNNRLYWSDEVYHIFELSPQKFKATYEAFLDYVHPEDRERVDSTYTRSIKEGSNIYEIEHRIKTEGADEVKYVYEKCFHTKDKKGKVFKSVGFVQDITDRKKTEKAIRESEQRYRAIFENTGSATVILENDGIISLANHRFAELSGYPIEEIENKKTWMEFAAKEDLGWMSDQHRIRRETTEKALKTYEFRFIDRAGNIKDIYLNVDTIQGTNKSVASLLDITPRKTAERELKQFYDNLFQLFKSSPAAMALTRVNDGKFITVNDAYSEIMGYDAREIIGNTVDDLDIYVNKAERKELIQQLKSTGKVNNYDLLVRHKDGSHLNLLVSMEPIHYSGEKSILSTFIDITQRKNVEKELRKSEQKFRDIFNHTADAIIIQNLQGYLVEVNDIACERMGYSRSELLKMHQTDIEAPEFKEKINERLHKIEQQGELNFESKVQTKDGTEIPVEINSRYIKYEGNPALLSVVRDISERKKMENVKQLLSHLSQLSLTTQTLKKYLRSLHQELGKIMKADNFYIALYDENTDTYILPYHVDECDDFTTEKNISLKNSLTDYIRKKGKAQLITADLEEKLKQQKTIEVVGTPSPVWIGAPIVDSSNNKVIGIIALQDYHDGEAYDEEDVNILNIVAANIGVFIDRIRNIEQLKLLSRSIEQNPVILIITDSKGTIEYVNPAFTQITGYSLDEVKGGNPRILQSGHHTKEFYKNLWETILSGNNWEGELHNRKKSGELYWEQAIISPILDDNGKITNFVGVKEDITEKKNMVEDLREAKEKAEESDRLKSAFLANMSHEIRTPMNGILGFTDLLQEPELSSNEKDQYINMIQKSGKRMLDTVNDIVEISKIEAGIMSLDPGDIDVNTCIEDLVQFFEPEAQKKDLELKIDRFLPENSSVLRLDQSKFESIVSNLIKNALKYTNQGSIHVGCNIREAYAEFYVQDTGIGVPKNRQKAIFNRFEQADISDTRAFEGSGLGLAISRSYTKMLGGEIWLESEENKGSVFYFSIPLGKHAATRINANQGDEEKNTSNSGMKPSKEKLKILIAEDDEDSFLYLSAIFKKMSPHIYRAITGKEAVDKYNEHPDTDLILMDIKLPEMDGYEATRKIRKQDRNIPIIAQTAYAMAGDSKKAVDAGCNDYITKPIKKKELLEKIDNLISAG